jgi:uncharacterized membrane protein YfcA
VTATHAVIIVAVGFVAGTVNTVVGSGTLLTFPTLLGLGYPAVLANVSNTVGLTPGYVTGSWGYRRELVGQQRRALSLLPAVIAGTITGSTLLLALPGSSFKRVVPFLLLLAVALVIIGPSVTRRRTEQGLMREHPGPLLHVGTFLTAVYGGYFGAAQSVVLLGLFGITLSDNIQRLNALKMVVSGSISMVAALFFIAVTSVAWWVALLMIAGSLVGGRVGAVIGRRLPPTALRAAIVLVGTGVAIKLLVSG